MSDIHQNPEKFGQVFGAATVTVDRELGDCVIRSKRPGACVEITKLLRLHSLDEIQGAYIAQRGLAATDPIAADVARALKFAAQQLAPTERKTRHVR